MSKISTRRWVVAITVACMLIVTIPFISNAAFKPGTAGSNVSTRYMLELDGQAAGTLFSFKGGNAVGAVVQDPVGSDRLSNKSLGQVKYEDITIEVGTGMSSSFYDWIKASLTMVNQRHDGAIVAVNAQGMETSRLEFHHALITEVTFPALDAASKDAAKMVIKMNPDYTINKKGSGTKAKSGPGVSKEQKKWMPANFRLKIDGLNTSKVNKIEALTIRQTAPFNDIGSKYTPEDPDGRLEFTDLVVTMNSDGSESLSNWFDEFVIKGHDSSESEKNGTLEFLSPNLKETYFTLELKRLGIFKLTTDNATSRTKTEMYCEQMVFSYNDKAKM